MRLGASRTYPLGFVDGFVDAFEWFGQFDPLAKKSKQLDHSLVLRFHSEWQLEPLVPSKENAAPARVFVRRFSVACTASKAWLLSWIRGDVVAR
jgi:hypothetical protein